MKNKQGRLIIIAICILLSMSLTLKSQEGRGNGRLAGSVKTKSGSPIDSAKISIVKLNTISGEFKLNTLSNKKGEWGIFGFASGQYLFKVEKEGYAIINKNINLTHMGRNPFMKLVMTVEEIKKEEEKKDSTENKSKSKIIKKGNKLFKDKKYKEALPIFLNFLEKYPENFTVAINLGNCYMELKDYKGAVGAFEKVLAGYKQNSTLDKSKDISIIYANIGEAYIGLKDYNKASVYYKKSMDISPPTDSAIAFNVAEIMFVGGKTDEAIEYYKLAVKLKPDMALYYSKLGYAYLNKGDIKNAISYFQKFIKMSPKDPQVPTIRTLIKQLNGQ